MAAHIYTQSVWWRKSCQLRELRMTSHLQISQQYRQTLTITRY